MECPSCTFQNAPGNTQCVRCQGLLDFSSVKVEPPRASGGFLRRQMRGSVAVVGFKVRDAVRGAETVASKNSRIRLDAGVTWGAAACSIVPGLGQVIIGRRLLGVGILVAWLVLMAAYLLNYGSGAGFFLGTLAVGVHCGAVTTLLSKTLEAETVTFRAVFGLGVYLVLTATVYGPMYWGTNELVGVVPVLGAVPPPGVTEGDLLIHTGPWLRPTLRRGDIVAYRIRSHRHGNVQLNDGVLFDRILGLPGDTVEVHGKELWVNGEQQPAELAPLGGAVTLEKITAGPDEYIIVPSVLRMGGQGYYQGDMQGIVELVSRVETGDVLGRIFWRVGAGLDFGPVKGSFK